MPSVLYFGMARERWEDDPEELDDETENYIDLLQQVVTNFIRTGDPNDYTGSPTNHTFDTILPFHQTQMVSNARVYGTFFYFSELFLPKLQLKKWISGRTP